MVETYGLTHIGLAVADPQRSLDFYARVDQAVDEVLQAGGKLLRRGEFVPGLPYAYVEDPDGYEIEIWYE